MDPLLPLPPVDPATTRVNNALFGMRRDLKMTVGDINLGLEFTESTQVRPTHYFEVELADMRLWIGVADIDRLPLSGSIGIESLSKLPVELLLGTLETLLDEPLQAAALRCGGHFQITAFVPAESLPDSLHAIGFRLLAGERFLTAGLVLGALAALELLAQLVSTAELQPTADVTRLPLPVSLEIGHTMVPLAELQQLEVHDILMIKNPCSESCDQAIARLPAPMPAWRVTVDADEVHFLEPVQLSETAAVEQAMQIRFRRGLLFLPMETLQASGTEFKVAAKLDQQIALVIDDQPFAVGSLVTVAGHVGVRVESLTPRS